MWLNQTRLVLEEVWIFTWSKKRPDVALSSVFWQLVTVRPFPPPARHFHPVKFNRNRWLVRDEQWKDHWGKYETYHISITVTERESLCCSSPKLVFNSSVWDFNSKLLCWVCAFLVRLKEEGRRSCSSVANSLKSADEAAGDLRDQDDWWAATDNKIIILFLPPSPSFHHIICLHFHQTSCFIFPPFTLLLVFLY